MSDSKSLNVRHHGSELNVCFPKYSKIPDQLARTEKGKQKILVDQLALFFVTWRLFLDSLGKSWAGLLGDNLGLDFLFSCSSPFDPTKYISIGGPPFSHLSYCSCDRVCHQQIQQVIKLPKSNNQRRKYDTLKIGNINTIGLSKTYGSVSVGREFWLCYVTFLKKIRAYV